MCGVAGALAADPRPSVPTIAARLTAALAHRGPDGEWFWSEQPSPDRRIARRDVPERASVVLGHRRLSIVDLATGDQPMGNEDGSVWVTFNGEIYNHLDLRRELTAAGHRFATQADTEVLVHGWEAWGPGLFGRLNGIYAFALVDRRAAAASGGRAGLWLVRDPAGVKPLYLGHSDGVWWFCSELAAARATGLLGRDLRRGAFAEYLVYRFVPSPGTFYANAWKVPPGHSCHLPFTAATQDPRFAPFTPVFRPTAVPRGRAQWAEAIREGLAGAVHRQLMSDVPLGTLLSGGVDSTVVTRLMREANGGGDRPQAFAVGLADDPESVELDEARAAAAALDVPLDEVIVPEREFLAAWPASIQALGEPIANAGVLLVGLLCRRIKGSRKVVLSGQGADEPLGGYPRHFAERAWRLARAAGPLLGALPSGIAASDRVDRMRRIARASDQAARFAEILAVFGPQEAASLTAGAQSPDELVAPVRRLLDGETTGDTLNALLRVDGRLSLADDLLIVADHMSMASSVELRVPFLDLEFLALLEAMPSRYKVSRFGERKWLYRQAVTPLLPPALRSRLVGWRARTGRKLGFTTPLRRWFGPWLRTEAEAFLLGPGARTPAFLAGDGVRAIVTAARDEGKPRDRQLLALYVLETWLRGAL
jgi:asparagine synthase (glutamine-hydrolysing)